MKKLVVCLVFLIFSEGAKLPSNFKKCNRNADPDLKKCTLEAAQVGIAQLTQGYPKIGVPSLDPLRIATVTIKAGSGKVAVDQTFKDCDCYGFDELKMKTFDFDFEKKILNFEGYFPQIKIKCQYKLDGKVLLLPIQGEGNSTVILKKLKFTAMFHNEEVKKRVKTYIKFIKSEVTQLEPEFMSFDFQNLFNGDKALGDNINKVLNENWKEVFEEVKEDYSGLTGKIIVGLLNNFFSKLSLEEALD